MTVEFKEFTKQVNIICALDHSSRAGNYFLQSVFDTHSQVLVCPWIQYDYSYLFTKFGHAEILPAQAAHLFWSKESYFRMVYQDLDPVLINRIISFGSSPAVAIDRKLVREVFDTLVLSQKQITRKDLLLASKYAYARGIGKNVAAVNYILVSDAVSLRSEDPVTGFSLSIVELIKVDFPAAKFISIERDPRATIASCRQQYVNQNGNMHGIKPHTFLLRLYNLLRSYFDTEGSAFVYFLMYSAATAKRMYLFKATRLPYVLKNEDLNLNFNATIEALCKYLGIAADPIWQNKPYTPTNVGLPWLGKGAYNPLYDKTKHAALSAQLDLQAQTLAGPNEYVTKRWRSQLPKNEIAMIEYLFREELDELNYEYLVFKNNEFSNFKFIIFLLQPYLGELPSLKWLRAGLNLGILETTNRLFYTVTLPLFYIVSRVMLLKAIFIRRHFQLNKI